MLHPIYHYISSQLKQVASSPNVESRWILEELFQQPYPQIASDSVLSTAQEARLESILRHRLNHEPLQYILGYAYFYDIKLLVSPSTLIPRPETEVLVHMTLEFLHNHHALINGGTTTVIDIGTGSGAIACALKTECPRAKVWASDCSEAALDVAKANAARLELALHFQHSDLLQSLQHISADVIVANLPYLPQHDAAHISPEVQREPASALFSGMDGLDLYRRLLEEVDSRVGTWVALELDPRNVQQAATLAQQAGHTPTIHHDLVGRERFLSFCIHTQ